MTCTCNETRELDEYGSSYEGDFVEDFEAMLDEFDQEEEGETYGDVDFESDELDQEAEIIGTDTRKLVNNTTDAPFRYVCNLAYDVPGIGYRAIGSGTLIGPRTVLTAGHCIHTKKPDGTEVLLDPRKMRVIPGRNGMRAPLGYVGAAKFHPFPGFVRVSPTDVGIIHLAAPLGSRVGFWTRAYAKNKGDTIGTSFISGGLPQSAGTLKVNLSGYPADMPHPNYGCRDPKQPANRCFHSRLSDKKRSPRCGTDQHRAYDLTVRLKGRILHYLNDTCPGHSGSPVWVRRSPDRGGRVLTAVHISGDDPKIPGKANRAVFLDATVRAWINRLRR